MSELAFVGDVHLEQDDPALPAFLEFLDRLGRRADRLVLLGDLFNLWLGRRELEQPHQSAVLERLHALRERGVTVRYLEGNRDFRVGRAYAGSALDDATDDTIEERYGGHRILAAHGDRINVADRRYRTWRRFARSPAVWGAFNLLPRRRRLALADALETRLRSTNLAFKQAFPEALVRSWATGPFARGCDLVVLGHFHVERDLVAGAGRIVVVPEWKGARRYLRVGQDGAVALVSA